MNRVQKGLYILSWIPVVAIKLVLVLLGLIMVPICLGTTNGEFSGMFWLWGNDDEGCPEWWLARAANGEAGKVAEWFPRFWWYAIRNPVNNMRFVFKDEGKVGYSGNWFTDRPMEAMQLLDAGQGMAYLWTYRGPFAGFRRVWLHCWLDYGRSHYSEIWFGWKVGSDVPGLGFTTQVRLKRKTGT